MAFSSKKETRKGITTTAGLMKAEERFQRDDKEADINNDGELSDYEKERADAIQKDKTMRFAKGGMMADDALGYDEESGNPIPLGSSAEEVRDDIDAKLSTGEFVLPADVVRYHGVKHILGMIDEAKMGLMAMHEDGMLQVDGEEESEEYDEEVETEDEEIEDEEEPKSKMYGTMKRPTIVFTV